MSDPLVRMTGITVRYPGTLACDGATLDVRAGEVHAIVGENGAGKSTLMHVLAGLVRPDAGRVEIDGRLLPAGRPRESRAAGIAMVFQRFRLVPALTVAQNVVLGAQDTPFLLSARSIECRVAALADALDLPIDPSARVADLTEGEKQRVEILRVFLRGARVLVLDEPTSVLTPGESERLVAWLRQRAAAGLGVLFVSHKMPEVLAVADRISVMRRGRVVATGILPADCTPARLASLVVGEGAEAAGERPAVSVPGGGVGGRGDPALRETGGPVLALSGVHARADAGRERLEAVDLDVAAGEIVGVAGVAGNGVGLLAAVATGAVAPASGTVRVRAADLSGAGVRAFLDAGVRYVPEDRDGLAVARDLSVTRNALLRRYREAAVSGGRFLMSAKRMALHARAVVDLCGARVPSLALPAASLSGGNLQKLVVARETESFPRSPDGPVAPPTLLVVVQPTQGLDVAATAAVRARIARLAGEGSAVLLASADLDEILELSDRVAVLYRGRLRLVAPSRPFDRAAIGRAMTGLDPEAP